MKSVEIFQNLNPIETEMGLKSGDLNRFHICYIMALNIHYTYSENISNTVVFFPNQFCSVPKSCHIQEEYQHVEMIETKMNTKCIYPKEKKMCHPSCNTTGHTFSDTTFFCIIKILFISIY